MDSLVSTEWLAAHLGEPDLVVLDATKHLATAERDEGAEFLERHIPGARFLDLARLADSASPIGTTLPGPMQVQIAFSTLGLTPDTRVVLYDDSAIRTSARAWLILRGYGILQVAILDGGLAKWLAEGRPVESGKGQVALAPMHDWQFAGAVKTKAEMLANIDSRAEQVVDARDAARFTGTSVDTVHGLPGGHIPGARNLFFRDLYAADGTFLAPAELRRAFADAGIDLDRPVTASCGSGVTASVVLFAMHLLGREGALYDGSWSEWGADPSTPKETGPAA